MTYSAESPRPPTPTDPTALLKTRSYVSLLLLGALIGVPVAAAAYYFLKVGQVDATLGLYESSRRPRVQWCTNLVAPDSTRRQRRAGGIEHPAPSWDFWTHAS